jgi:RNA 3'-terminal phosphate cyclase (ATP)
VDAEVTGKIVIDGSHGEGGGQIVRTSLCLSAITGRELEVEHVRAGRPKPGLAAQHVTAVLSIAKLCDAVVTGATLGSQSLSFRPRKKPQSGDYVFDVAEAREGGSAGAASLVLQTVVPAALFADGSCHFRILGGTHVSWSPPFDFLAHAWRPFLARMGVALDIALGAYGFFPLGQGEIVASLQGQGSSAGATLKPIKVIDRGQLRTIRGRALAANLPAHIPQRMADRASALLARHAERVLVEPQRIRAASPGAAIFLTAEFDELTCCFSAFGRRGKPSEAVAEEVAEMLLRHLAGRAALDVHLADQVLLPLSLARGRSLFSCLSVTRHMESNAWVIRQFGVADIGFERGDSGRTIVTVEPAPCAVSEQGGKS